MIKTIIFDLGDVIIPSADRSILVNTSKFLGIDENKLAKLMNEYLPDLQVANMSELEFWNKIIEEGGLSRRAKEDLDKLFIEPYKKEFFINKDILGLIKSLVKKYSVGCISNTIESHALFNRERGIYKYFHPCILSNEVKVRKPDIKIFELYLEQVDCKASEALFITEINPKFSGAQEAGLNTLQFFDVDRLKEGLSNLNIKL